MSDPKGTPVPLETLVGSSLRAPVGGTDTLEEVTAWLAGGLRAARQRYPEVNLSDQLFVRHLAARLEQRPPVKSLALAAKMHLPELFLCAACGEGDGAAQQRFDAEYLAHLREPIRRVQDSFAFEEEVLQLLREKLLLGLGGRPPKIRDYSGRGPLVAWLRAAAVRTALNHVEQHGREVAVNTDGWARMQGPGDPELAILRTRFKNQFSEAFERSLQALPQRDRNLLRLHLLDGVNIDKLGLMFNAHRATIARWLAKSREQLVEDTKAELLRTLKVDSRELDELMGLLRSQLDVSIHRFLRKAAE